MIKQYYDFLGVFKSQLLTSNKKIISFAASFFFLKFSKFVFIHVKETYFHRQTKMGDIIGEISEELKKSAVMAPSPY